MSKNISNLIFREEDIEYDSHNPQVSEIKKSKTVSKKIFNEEGLEPK